MANNSEDTAQRQWYQIISGGLHGRKEGDRVKYYKKGDKILLTASEAKSGMLRDRIEKTNAPNLDTIKVESTVDEMVKTSAEDDDSKDDDNASSDPKSDQDPIKGWESIVTESSLKDLTELIESMTEASDLKLIRQVEVAKYNRPQILAVIDKQLQPKKAKVEKK